MKKIFLTSGLVLCMACPAAMAATNLVYTPADGDTPASWNPAANGNNCTETYLGTAENGANVAFDPIFDANTYTITYYGGTAKNNGVTHAVDTGDANAVAVSVEYDGLNYTVKGNSGTNGTNFSVLGYSFTGWRADHKVTSDGDNSVAAGASTPLTDSNTAGGTQYSANDNLSPYKVVGDTNMYAQWSANPHTITYQSGSGTGEDVVQNVHYDDVSVALKSISEAGFSKTGYHFAGWESTNNFNDTLGNAATTTSTVYGAAVSGQPNANWTPGSISQYVSDHDATFTAQWVANGYTVTYLCGGSTVNGVNHSASYTAAGTAKHVYDVTFDASADALKTVATMCSFTGYTPNGWSCVADEGGATVATPFGGTNGAYNYAGSVTCTAQWTQNSINLKWYDDEGSANEAEGGAASCSYDAGITLPTNPGKDGYTFKGWKVRN